VGENYHDVKRLRAAQPAHGVREARTVPNMRRVLASQTPPHDARQPVHAPLRLLRGAQGTAEPMTSTSRGAWRKPGTLGLEHAVITSVNRDDDWWWGAYLRHGDRGVRRQAPGCRVEVLIPISRAIGRRSDLRLEARPSAQPQHRVGWAAAAAV